MFEPAKKLLNKQIIFGHLLPLMIGISIYLAFRPKSIIAFKWLDDSFLNQYIIQLREIALPYKKSIPEWIIYSLPDGLWIFSYTSLMLFIWNNVISKQNAIWLFAFPLLAILSEIAQWVKIIPGTFDYMDIFLFFVGTFFPFLIFTRINKTKLSI